MQKALTLGDLLEIVIEATPDIDGPIPALVPDYVMEIVDTFPPNEYEYEPQTTMLITFLCRISPLGEPTVFGFDARTMVEQATGLPCPFYSDWRWSRSEGWREV